MKIICDNCVKSYEPSSRNDCEMAQKTWRAIYNKGSFHQPFVAELIFGEMLFSII